jgi:hypothetical protein
VVYEITGQVPVAGANTFDDGVFNLCIAATLRMPLRLLADD